MTGESLTALYNYYNPRLEHWYFISFRSCDFFPLLFFAGAGARSVHEDSEPASGHYFVLGYRLCYIVVCITAVKKISFAKCSAAQFTTAADRGCRVKILNFIAIR